MGKWIFAAVILLVIIVGIVILLNRKSSETARKIEKTNSVIVKKGNMKINSSAFGNGSSIPVKYTCDGQGINPPLSFLDVPQNAKSIALIMEDPDVPKNLKPDGMFDHWVVFNMPASTVSISDDTTPPGIVGKSSAGTNTYIGPCPPDREHRYFFKLYALDSELNLDANVTKKDLEKAMQDHVLDQAQLIGLYNRK